MAAQYGDGRWDSDDWDGTMSACGCGCWEPVRLPQDGTGGWCVRQRVNWSEPGPGWWADGWHIGIGDGAWDWYVPITRS